MTTNRTTQLPSMELPQCQICYLDPVPQNSQYWPFVMLQIILAFVNFKFSIIALALGYSISRTHWLCPQCKRQIEVKNEPQEASNNVIIRVGNCMALLSKLKFRIIAAAIIIWMIYLYSIEPAYHPKIPIQKNWENMATNCGYEVYMQNSFKANYIYFQYSQSGKDWVIDGIYLGFIQEPNNYRKILVKMDPSQFKNPDTQDFILYTNLANNLNLQKGDVIRMFGEWEGRYYHTFMFIPIRVEKTQKKMDPASVKLLGVAKNFIRIHEAQKQNKPKEEVGTDIK